jgi:hypothetical protein
MSAVWGRPDRWPEILCGPPDLGPSYYNVAEQLAGFLSLRPVSRQVAVEQARAGDGLVDYAHDSAASGVHTENLVRAGMSSEIS